MVPARSGVFAAGSDDWNHRESNFWLGVCVSRMICGYCSVWRRSVLNFEPMLEFGKRLRCTNQRKDVENVQDSFQSHAKTSDYVSFLA